MKAQAKCWRDKEREMDSYSDSGDDLESSVDDFAQCDGEGGEGDPIVRDR
jgi:hypothetical protein